MLFIQHAATFAMKYISRIGKELLEKLHVNLLSSNPTTWTNTLK